MGKRELVALLNLSSWCLVMVERLFLGVHWDCLRFVIVVFPDHTHLLFLPHEGQCKVAGYRHLLSHTTFQFSGGFQKSTSSKRGPNYDNHCLV